MWLSPDDYTRKNLPTYHLITTGDEILFMNPRLRYLPNKPWCPKKNVGHQKR